jgi:CRISPR-associated endonuclease/helicase Cas3
MPPRLQPLDPVPGPGALERHFERVGSVEAAVEAVVDHAKVGRSVVWFRNTVDDAREAYDRLFAETRQRGLPEPPLSSRMRVTATVATSAGPEGRLSN